MRTKYKPPRVYQTPYGPIEGVVVKAGEVLNVRCCDCGLVHRIALVPTRGGTFVGFRRDNRATANTRRGK